MIEFKQVSASYDAEVPILKDVSFTINDGDFVAFVGTNGAGKSTTMRLCNGLLKPTSGQVLIDGTPTTELKTSQLARKIGFLFQNPDNQICCQTVREELQFGFKALGEYGPDADSRIDEVMEMFGFDPEADPFLLNRGTRQLLALASIVVLGTPVIILDEPTTGLDFRECEKVMEIVRRLHSRGTTIIMVCHDMEVVADFAKKVIVMTKGKLIAQGPTFSILRDPAVLREADLVPPQIAEISMQLLAQNAIGPQSSIAQANTVEEMLVALKKECDSATCDKSVLEGGAE